MTTVHARRSHTTDTSTREAPAKSVLELVVQAINNPRAQTPDVAEAVAVLSAAARRETSTAPIFILSGTSTAATSRRFDGVVSLLTEVIYELDLDDNTHDYLFSEALPHFVPEGWSQFLRTPVVEDRGFELPWLQDLNGDV